MRHDVVIAFRQQWLEATDLVVAGGFARVAVWQRLGGSLHFRMLRQLLFEDDLEPALDLLPQLDGVGEQLFGGDHHRGYLLVCDPVELAELAIVETAQLLLRRHFGPHRLVRTAKEELVEMLWAPGVLPLDCQEAAGPTAVTLPLLVAPNVVPAPQELRQPPHHDKLQRPRPTEEKVQHEVLCDSMAEGHCVFRLRARSARCQLRKKLPDLAHLRQTRLRNRPGGDDVRMPLQHLEHGTGPRPLEAGD
mmetsp:Transcript_3041/g.12294  ORF Transcript_3041/g.12294 Transcript_3041/m.12294 type:complete len:248 (+) Transcript_3041:1208-1951(+)